MDDFPHSENKQLIVGKDTFYNGRLYRSILEARWAVLFVILGIKFMYKPTKFETALGWYLPDFYYPNLSAWGEIKPTPPSGIEETKVQTVADITGEPALILSSFPKLEHFPTEGESGPELQLSGAVAYLYLPKEKSPLRVSANRMFNFLKEQETINGLIQGAVLKAQNFSFKRPVHVGAALLQLF